MKQRTIRLPFRSGSHLCSSVSICGSPFSPSSPRSLRLCGEYPSMKVDPKKLLGKLDQMRKEKPFRYLGRRVVQAMAECASENPLVGQRSAAGRYLVVRLVRSGDEK